MLAGCTMMKPQHAAAPVPAMTGATALGSVRGRAPDIHCAKVATRASSACHAHAINRGDA